MLLLRTLLAAFGLLGLSLGDGARAQTPNNDGFQRRNGQMHVLRNGQLRPMTRDARLPTGAVVTKDGFVVAADGRRTELREGQGCDLRGNLVGTRADAAGRIALDASGRAAGAGLGQLPAGYADGRYQQAGYGRGRQKHGRGGKKGKKRWKPGKDWDD